jgi:hypothetical protein
LVNDWVASKLLPVYQDPPPNSIPPNGNIEPVVPGEKLDVAHLVWEVELSLNFQEQPLDDVGKFVYLPVPSCHDSEIGYTSINCLQFLISHHYQY